MMQTQINKTVKKIKAPIHCPVSGCLYFTGSERYFTEKKFLNQHIAKVHAEKKYLCGKCKKSFGLDWWRKHHEKTCGTEWKCECGGRYTSRESLLTHARRHDHKLPDHLLNPDKASQAKQSKFPLLNKKNPVVLLIQPIIQNLTCIQPTLNAAVTPRPILPKTMQPHVFKIPVTTSTGKNVYNLMYTSSVFGDSTNEKFVYNNVQQNSINDLLNNQLLSSTNSSPHIVNSNVQKPSLQNAETQTSSDLECSYKPKESRASQCSRRKSKAADVGIESTHTQTAESAVVKIKRKRSRRKSVAITTESTMPTGQSLSTGNSLWPNFKDLIVPENASSRAFKNTTSTQTGSNKILCDSQTITDDELLKFVWNEAVTRKDSNDSPFGMLQDMAVDDSLSAISDGLSSGNLPSINMFSSNTPIVDTVLSQHMKNDSKSVNSEASIAANDPVDKGITDDTCSMFSACTGTDVNNKVSPIFSDIHTQTMASNVLDYNLLANMETQTTDDFSLYDLEFLDTETQTPWEDFPNIDDSPLPADQLSIEIQTDFSSLGSKMDQDPYDDFINDLYVQSMITDCSTKESLGVNCETQTQDWTTLPEFTNSESQTLDLPSFLFSK